MKKIIHLLLSCLLAGFAIHAQGIGGKAGFGGKAGIGGSAAASYLYYGYGCAGTSTNTCTVGGNTGGGLNSLTIGEPITTGSDASGYTVKAVGVFFNAVAGTMIAAIYTSGGTLVSNCTASSSVTPSGSNVWYENTNFSGCSLAANTAYYVSYQTSSGSAISPYDNTGNATVYVSATYGTFASSVSFTVQAASRSVYARVTAN